MPNRRVHTLVGTVGGGLAALHLARDQRHDQASFEAVGGLIGGWVGARLPDVFDPPTSPNHRGAAHSLVLGGGSSVALAQRVRDAQFSIRAIAHDLDEGGHAILAALSLVGAGVVPGLAFGYASHLALDAFTPRSLPLLR